MVPFMARHLLGNTIGMPLDSPEEMYLVTGSLFKDASPSDHVCRNSHHRCKALYPCLVPSSDLITALKGSQMYSTLSCSRNASVY